MGRKKNAEFQDDEEGVDAEDYSTELNAEEDEPEERAPKRRRFGFWHKWNEDDEDEAEEETGEEPEDGGPEEDEEPPAREHEPFRLFHRERRAEPQEEPASGTV